MASMPTFDMPSSLTFLKEGKSERENASNLAEHAPELVEHAAQRGISLNFHQEVEDLREEWLGFEQNAINSLFQSYHWLSRWQRHMAAGTQETPFIVMGRNARGQLLFILPLARRKAYGLTILQWFGQSHANYNMGLFAPDFLSNLTHEDIHLIVNMIAAEASDCALMDLQKQPLHWQGYTNPFTHFPYQPSVNSSYNIALGDDFDGLYEQSFSARSRSTLRRKEKKLNAQNDMTVGWSEGPGARADMLNKYLEQKALQFNELGIEDIFAPKDMQAFYHALAAGEPGGERPFQLDFYALEAQGELAATFNGICYKDRFYMIISSSTLGELKRWSPGLVLMRHQIQSCIERGMRDYDLGTGAADHKDSWANGTIELMDQFMPLKIRGGPAATALVLKTIAKRGVKNNPKLWTFTKRLRQKIKGRR